MTGRYGPGWLLVLLSGLNITPVIAAEQAENSPVPQRVVSMNLCTDQLALLLAKPGQLQGVTWMAQDPMMSMLPEQARQLPAHRGTAEEIYTLRSDLVLTGTYTAQATLDMLNHLGRRVVAIPPAFSFADIRKNIRQVGDVLGQSELATQLLHDFDSRHRKIADNSESFTPGQTERKQLTAVSYGANLYMPGDQSLEKDMVESAGFVHYSSRQNLGGYGGRVALEQLVMEPPDVLLLDHYQQKGVRAYAHLVHPVLNKIIPLGHRAGTQSKHWVCGTPYVLEAVTELVALRQSITGLGQ